MHNKFDDLRNGEHSTIELWVRVILQEEDMRPSTAARLRFVEETSIRVCTQDHVASTIDDAVVGIGYNIIK